MSVWEKAHLKLDYIILGIFHFQELYLCKQRETFVWVFNYVWGKVKSTLSGLQLLVFHLHINFFETLIRSIIYCQIVHVFGPFTDLLVSWYVVKNGMSAFLCLLLRLYYWQYMFCLDQCWIEITCSSHNLWHWEEITRWCMDLQWWKLLSYHKCNIFPTSCIEISLWKKPIHNWW